MKSNSLVLFLLGLLSALVLNIANAETNESRWSITANSGECTIVAHTEHSLPKIVGPCESYVNGGIIKEEGQTYSMVESLQNASNSAVIKAAMPLFSASDSFVIMQNSIVGPQVELVTPHKKEAAQYLLDKKAYHVPYLIMDGGYSLQIPNGPWLTLGPALDRWIDANR